VRRGIALSGAAVVFPEPRKFLHLYLVDIVVAAPSNQIMQLPSLLGRDILDRWRMIYEPSRGRLTFDVRTADQRITLAAR